MKEKVGKALAKRVKTGQTLGLGSGSTVEAAIKCIGQRILNEGLDVSGIPTSRQIAIEAEQAGIKILSAVSAVNLDWAFDGADEVDPQLNMIKGGGAAMLNEKIVGCRSPQLVIIVTEEKLVDRLGEKFPVPIEVIPEAFYQVLEEVSALGAKKVELRQAAQKFGPVITEHNNFVLDAWFDDIQPELESEIKKVTGVVESGLFINKTQEVLIAKKDGIWVRRKSGDMVSEEPLS